MSTSDASTAQTSQPSGAVLPPGWTAGPARETTATNAQTGQVQQGVVVPITSPNQAQTTVFIPYSVLQGPVAGVQAVFDQRINALMALPGQG